MLFSPRRKRESVCDNRKREVVGNHTLISRRHTHTKAGHTHTHTHKNGRGVEKHVVRFAF